MVKKTTVFSVFIIALLGLIFSVVSCKSTPKVKYAGELPW